MVARLGTRLARSCQAEKALARIYFAYYENPLRRVSFLAQLINELLPGDLELQVSSVTRLHLHPHHATHQTVFGRRQGIGNTQRTVTQSTKRVIIIAKDRVDG